MKKEINLNGTIVEYSLRSSLRARSIRLSIHTDGECVVTKPSRISDALVESFMIDKSVWILKHLEKIKKNPKVILSKNSKQDFIIYKEKAQTLAYERLKHFNKHYNLEWKSITIRNQKTRWGSCSKRGALSFSYKIALLDSKLADYIIVHELCHLGQFNHSVKFWALVAETIPDYKILRKHIKQTQ